MMERYTDARVSVQALTRFSDNLPYDIEHEDHVNVIMLVNLKMTTLS
jgi:hypothetical protein